MFGWDLRLLSVQRPKNAAKILDRVVTFHGVSGNHRRTAEEDRQTENTPVLTDLD